MMEEEPPITEFQIFQEAETGRWAAKWLHPQGELVQYLPVGVPDYYLCRCKAHPAVVLSMYSLT